MRFGEHEDNGHDGAGRWFDLPPRSGGIGADGPEPAIDEAPDAWYASQAAMPAETTVPSKPRCPPKLPCQLTRRHHPRPPGERPWSTPRLPSHRGAVPTAPRQWHRATQAQRQPAPRARRVPCARRTGPEPAARRNVVRPALSPRTRPAEPGTPRSGPDGQAGQPAPDWATPSPRAGLGRAAGPAGRAAADRQPRAGAPRARADPGWSTAGPGRQAGARSGADPRRPHVPAAPSLTPTRADLTSLGGDGFTQTRADPAALRDAPYAQPTPILRGERHPPRGQ